MNATLGEQTEACLEVLNFGGEGGGVFMDVTTKLVLKEIVGE